MFCTVTHKTDVGNNFMRARTKNDSKVGRPRQYDPDQALDAAMALLWQKGFAGSSLDEIARHAGMNRPSLAAAFGDKRSLYLAAIQRFGQKLAASMVAALAMADPAQAIGDALTAAVSLYLGDSSDAQGCFVICTAPAETSDPVIKDALRQALDALDQLYHDALMQAHQQGRLRPNCPVTGLAKLIAAGQINLALRARAGADRQELIDEIANIVQVVRCFTL